MPTDDDSSQKPPAYGPNNPHPLSTMRTELVWDGKYDEWGNRREIDIAGCVMPLQKIETVDEPRARVEAQGDFFEPAKAHHDDLRNLLIWGDNKLVTASLLREFRGSIDLIYIDPPFDVGADFSMNVAIGDEKEMVGKEQSALEMVAYRDIWGRGSDSYLHMMYERLVIMRDLLADDGSIWVHCDMRVNSTVRLILDDIFGAENLHNDVRWIRSLPHNDPNQFGRSSDTILYYSKGEHRTFNAQFVPQKAESVAAHYRPDENGRMYRLASLLAPGGRGPRYEYKGVTKNWRFTPEKMSELEAAGRVYFKEGQMPSRIYYLDESKGSQLQDVWTDVSPLNPMAEERVGYDTQKPEALLERIVNACTKEGALVADLFCGSGTTGAVAERLGRRWIMADLGRFSIHTSRKRLIELQRRLHAEGKSYRAFDLYNLGRYERQWWQQERLEGADEEHRRVVLEFYGAEVLANTPSPLLHGRKGPALCHVDGIDSIFTREEASEVAQAAAGAGAKEVVCLAWEFEMDVRMECNRLEKEYGVKFKLIQIPREIMEKNRNEPPPFLEVATLVAEPVYKTADGKKTVDIKLTSFIPSLAEVPTKELKALQERAIKSGFDFIDFWAVDFDYRNGGPFNHHWQDYRTRKDRSLKTVSDQGYVYTEKGEYSACVKVVDIFGCDTSIIVPVKYG